MNDIQETDKDELLASDPTLCMFEQAREYALQYDYLLQQVQLTTGTQQDLYVALLMSSCVRCCCSLFCAEKIAAISSLPSDESNMAAYTNRYLLMHVKSSIFENYLLLRSKKNKKGKTIWDRFTRAVNNFGTPDLVNRLNTLDASFNTYHSDHIDVNFRNNTFHYARNSHEYYEQIKNITSDEPILPEAEEFARLMLDAISLATDLEEHICSTHNLTLPSQPLPALTTLEQEHKEMESLFTPETVTFFEKLVDATLRHQSESNQMFKATDAFKTEYDKLPEQIDGISVKPSMEYEHQLAQQTIQGYMYVYAATLDVLTTILAYHHAPTFGQKLMLIHRIHITVAGIMERVYTKDNTTHQLKDSIWKSIKEEIDNASDYDTDYGELEQNLEEIHAKVLSGVERHILVHYFDDGKPNVTQFINLITTIRPQVEVGKGISFLIITQQLQNCIFNYLQYKTQIFEKERLDNLAIINQNIKNIEDSIAQCPNPEMRLFLNDMLNKARGIVETL